MNRAIVQRERSTALEAAGSNLRSTEVLKNGDVAARARRSRTDPSHGPSVRFVSAMRNLSSRNTSVPASTSRASIASESLAGPTVETIFVCRTFGPSSLVPSRWSLRPFFSFGP